MASNFQASIEIKNQEDGELVRYKPDGERFPNGQPNTVKFTVGSNYTVTVTFRPPKLLQYWSIRGEKMEFNRIKPKKDDDDVTMYETHWPTFGLNVTKRGERTPLSIELEFDHGVSLKTTLQSKFYPSKETTHSKWGQELHALELKCQVQDGSTFADVKNEKMF